MAKKNSFRGRGEVAARPYFDMVPRRKGNVVDRIAFFKVLIDFPRDATQALDATHAYDRLRVVAYGKLAEALRGKIKPGDWLYVEGYIQLRLRSEAGESGESGVVEIVMLEYDHFMRPFIPQTPLMERLESLAEARNMPVRELMTQILDSRARSMEIELQPTGGNGG